MAAYKTARFQYLSFFTYFVIADNSVNGFKPFENTIKESLNGNSLDSNSKMYHGYPVSSESYASNFEGSAYVVYARDSEGTFCLGVLKNVTTFWSTTLCDRSKTPFTITTGSMNVMSTNLEEHISLGYPSVYFNGVLEIPFSPPLNPFSLTKLPLFYKGRRPPPAGTECRTYGYSTPDGVADGKLNALRAWVTETSVCGVNHDGLQGTNFCVTIDFTMNRDGNHSAICEDDKPSVLVCYISTQTKNTRIQEYSYSNKNRGFSKHFCNFNPNSALCVEWCTAFSFLCSSTTQIPMPPKPTTESTTALPPKIDWVVVGIQVKEAAPCASITNQPILYTLFPNYYH